MTAVDDARATRPAQSWRLGRRTRKAVLVTHVTAAGAWIGMDLVLLVLSLRAWFADSARERAVSMQALELFGVAPMISLALLTLASGVLLGLGTRHGLLRHWWVVAKLTVNLVFAALLVGALRPGLREAADAGADLAAGVGNPALAGDMVFPLTVSLSGLLFAVILSVFKPWGRIRPSRKETHSRRASR
jgi:hypothetical protein